ncbi:hypothetical protein EB118_24760 [bacterium]|nr:hypothetical protein [Synechococcaceae bacterium WB6_1A_059]NDG33265.1 hypothetical protein [bacterium]NDG80134.1 hypothetical protein [Synechococcaceae bacterium WB8_1B_057]
MKEEKTIRQTQDFRLVLRKTLSAAPDNFYHIELESQQIRDKTFKSSYSFFLTKEEIKLLSEALLND